MSQTKLFLIGGKLFAIQFKTFWSESQNAEAKYEFNSKRNCRKSWH